MAEPRRPAETPMVLRVGPEHWRTYRDVRLAALIDSPRAFWETYARAAGRSEVQWRDRLGATSPVWLALEGDRPVGTVGLFQAPERPADEGVVVGMWVATASRGTGVADLLVGAALEHARAAGWRRVELDVADENARAGAFYRRLGFVPTGAAGSMPWDPSVTERTLRLDLGS